jgi:hypothetical protein
VHVRLSLLLVPLLVGVTLLGATAGSASCAAPIVSARVVSTGTVQVVGKYWESCNDTGGGCSISPAAAPFTDIQVRLVSRLGTSTSLQTVNADASGHFALTLTVAVRHPAGYTIVATAPNGKQAKARIAGR